MNPMGTRFVTARRFLEIHARTGHLGELRATWQKSPRQDHRLAVVRKFCGTDVARSIPGGEAHPLQFEEFGVCEGRGPFECRDEARRQSTNANLEMPGIAEGDRSRVSTPDLFVCHID